MSVRKNLGFVEEFLKTYQMTLWLAFITSITTAVWRIDMRGGRMEERIDNHEVRLQKLESTVPPMELKIHDLERDGQHFPSPRYKIDTIPRSPSERRGVRIEKGVLDEE